MFQISLKKYFLALITLVIVFATLYIFYNNRLTNRNEEFGPPENRGILQELTGQDSITTAVNAKAPGLASVSLDNKDIRSIDFIGEKVVLLEFWSVFCTSCIQEMPFLAELYQKYHKDGLEVVGVNTDYFGVERIRRFFARLDPKPPYPVIHDQDQSISKAFNVEALPVTVLIDSSGWIRMYHLGYKPADQKTIEKRVVKWLGKIKETTETVRPVDGKTPIAVTDNTMISEGSLLPEIISIDNKGRQFSLNDFRGDNPMVLFFWSLFCQPCRREMPFLSSKADSMKKENNILFLSVNLDSARLDKQVSKFLARNPMSFPTLLDARSDPPGSFADKIGVSYTPTIVMVDRVGMVEKVLVGDLPSRSLEDFLQQFVLAQKNPE